MISDRTEGKQRTIGKDVLGRTPGLGVPQNGIPPPESLKMTIQFGPPRPQPLNVLTTMVREIERERDIRERERERYIYTYIYIHM